MSCSMEFLSSKLLCSSENFQVVYNSENTLTMIRSKGPCGCSGALSDLLFKELTELKELVNSGIEQPICFYEYGMKKNTSLELLILFDEPLSLLDKLNKNFDFLIMREFNEITTMYDRFGDYVYYENADKEKYFFCLEPVATKNRDVADILDEPVSLTAWGIQS